jgi:outer membrane protein, heavy metal efflux system
VEEEMAMFPRGIAVTGALVALAPGCFSVRHTDYESFARPAQVVPGVGDQRSTKDALAADEQGLANEARLPPILRLAIARNRDIGAEALRVRASTERVGAAGRLPDLELKYEQWGVPLARPWALDQAETLMLGLRQTFPAPGSLDALSRAAGEEAEIELTNLRMQKLDVAQQVRRAYYEYLLAAAEYAIHVEHADITDRLIALARANFRVGKASQQDVLKMGVELTRLHTDLAALEQRKQSSAGLLNALMARSPDAPMEITASLADLEKRADASRPEIGGAEHAVSRGAAQLDAAERTASWPSFTVGVDYWLRPAGEPTHAYGAMVSINLPWLNPRHRAEVRAQEHDVTAQKGTVDSVRITVRYQVHDAYARYQAALASFRIIDQALLPQARQSFEAAQSTYSTGGGDALGLLDALRSLLQVRLDHVRARVALAVSVGEVERAVSADIERQPLTKGTQP